MMFSHVVIHVNRTRWPSVSSALIALVCLSGLLWLSVAPAFMVTPCGLLLPHDHLLLGGAGEGDLEAHLAAEAACAVGGPVLAMQHAHLDKREIVSVPHFEAVPSMPGGILNLDQLMLAIPALLVGSGPLTLFIWLLPFLRVTERPPYLLLWDPPPESGSLLAH